MLLQRLKELTERPGFEVLPTLYSYSPVRYVIELDSVGRLLSPQPTDRSDPSTPRTRRGLPFLVPQVQRSSGVKPLLLADKADYVLGHGGPHDQAGSVAQRHSAFLDLLDRCAATTEEPAAMAVQRFLRASPLETLRLGDTFDPSGIITFRVDGVFPVDLPSIRAFWAAENDPALKQARVLQCLVCGEERPVLDRLQAKIKGVPGGQTSGTSLISANAEAFESYGLTASLVAPTCADCGERFTRAANALLAGTGSRVVLGGVAFIYWTREDVPFNLLTFIMDANPDDVRRLLESVRRGERLPDVDDTRFYATALSGSGGRAVVREWIDTTVGEVKRHLARWFDAQEIVDGNGDAPRPLGLYALAAATVRDPRKDLAPPTPRTLLHTALTGAPAPIGLLAQAVLRNRAEQRVTRPRAALIKLVLQTQGAIEEGALVRLNPEHPNPAYHCGRLLAVLEDVQRLAIPGIKATIVDRFFGAASSSPNLVFSRLIRGAQPHLAKLERDNRGAFIALQRRLEDIIGHLDGFPKFLALKDQGLFALGYYHQHAFDRGQAREAAARRRAGLPTSPEDVPALPDTLAEDSSTTAA